MTKHIFYKLRECMCCCSNELCELLNVLVCIGCFGEFVSKHKSKGGKCQGSVMLNWQMTMATDEGDTI